MANAAIIRLRLSAIFLAAALLLIVLAYLRAPEYDEAYSIFLTANHPRPAWPAGVLHPAGIRHFYTGSATFMQIASNLRTGDVHPPLYFWALEIWRRFAGPSWFAARMLSVLFTLATLATLSRLAVLAKLPVIPALSIALLSYGFAYTGIIVRGFALAQLLNIAGLALVFAARRETGWRFALCGGLALGAATFTNYLAIFTGLAALVWLAATARHLRLILPASIAFALFLPADAYFYIAQKSSRIGQFTAFSLPHAVALLAKDSAAALYGGLPLYAGRFAPIVILLLAALTITCAIFAWRRRTPASTLFAFTAIATPAGLLALGLIFHNTPIEIRYLAFSLPCIALLLAPIPRTALIPLLTVEAAAIAGLAFAPATMQPQAAAAAQAQILAGRTGLILLPYGNDGVGIPGPFLQSLPDSARVELVKPGRMPNLANETLIVTANIAIDDASRAATDQLAAMLSKNPCWQAVPATNLAHAFKFTCENLFPLH